MMSPSGTFSQTFILLQQEGFLFSAAIATGLSELRKASVQNKGAFYSSMFNLSIGLERLMKALLIMEHMLAHSLQPPTQAQLRAYGHDLHALYDSCHSVSLKESTTLQARSDLEPLTAELLWLLNHFAKTARYHNLNSLSASHAAADPLEKWNGLLMQLLRIDASQKKQQAILAAAGTMAKLFAGRAIVQMQGLDKRNLTLEEALGLPGLQAEAVRHAVVRLGLLISRLRDLLGDLSRKAYSLRLTTAPFPQMHEFLEWLPDSPELLARRSRWP